MSDAKFCKDCKYYKRDFPFFWMTSLAVCTAPQGFDMQTGKPATSYAGTARIFGHMCGSDGKWFEPK